MDKLSYKNISDACLMPLRPLKQGKVLFSLGAMAGLLALAYYKLPAFQQCVQGYLPLLRKVALWTGVGLGASVVVGGFFRYLHNRNAEIKTGKDKIETLSDIFSKHGCSEDLYWKLLSKFKGKNSDLGRNFNSLKEAIGETLAVRALAAWANEKHPLDVLNAPGVSASEVSIYLKYLQEAAEKGSRDVLDNALVEPVNLTVKIGADSAITAEHIPLLAGVLSLSNKSLILDLTSAKLTSEERTNLVKLVQPRKLGTVLRND
jgi:hypothetical protein